MRAAMSTVFSPSTEGLTRLAPWCALVMRESSGDEEADKAAGEVAVSRLPEKLTPA